MKRFAILFYIILLALIAGVVISGQLLGFFSLYTPWAVAISTLLFTCLFAFLLYKFGFNFLLTTLEQPQRIKIPKWAAVIAVVGGIALLVVVLVLPLALWPYTGIQHELNWDAGLYHLPKAAQMVVSHSSWDLSIAYGEYPYGFESLLAASLLLNKAGYLLGLTHALSLLFFVLSLTFLACRYSKLPVSYAFFLVVFVLASYDIIRLANLNPFMIFRVMAFTIGKNDFFLSAAMLAFLFFAPIGPDRSRYSLIGLSLTSMLVACTKPNGFLLLLFVWLFVLIMEVRRWIKNKKIEKRDIYAWIGVILINLSGLLWIIRNLVVQGTLVSSESLWIQQYSILSNLANPLFYNHLGTFAWLVLALLGVSILALITFKHVDWTVPLAFLVLILSFVITPATLYFETPESPAIIFWRLGLYLLAFTVPLVLLLLDPAIKWLFARKISLPINLILSALIVGISFIGCYKNYSRIKPDPANTLVLRDQYTDSVGVDGYFSAYDYVRRNVTHSVVWIENGLPFYLFGEDLTNSVSHQTEADYHVFLQTNWNGGSGFPPLLATNTWKENWTLVYADPEGRVYKRNQ